MTTPVSELLECTVCRAFFPLDSLAGLYLVEGGTGHASQAVVHEEMACTECRKELIGIMLKARNLRRPR